jgi:hypothetical protein
MSTPAAKPERILQRGQIFVIAGDTETAARAMQAFDRTAKCLKLVNQFTQDVLTGTDEGKDEARTLQIINEFARKLVTLYPGGPQQCIADQQMFRNVTLDPKAVM